MSWRIFHLTFSESCANICITALIRLQHSVHQAIAATRDIKGVCHMRNQLKTTHLRRLVNQLVDSTVVTPSLAEMLRHHLETEWTRLSRPPYDAIYHVHDGQETFIELRVLDASAYQDIVYEKGRALLSIGVNGALASPGDEERVNRLFPNHAFRTCPHCHQRFERWFDYYGHIHLDHFPLGLVSGQ